MTLAGVDIVRRNGDPAVAIVDTWITAGATRASTSDAAAPGANNPILIPVAGTNYSFWVTTRLYVTTNPDGHTVNNLKWFAATNNLPSGVTIKGQEANIAPNAGYRWATGTVGTSGTLLNTTNHTGLTGATVDVFSFTTGSPKSLGGTNSATGFGTFSHFVYQVAVDSTAVAASPASANTFSWRYDEA